MKFTLFLFGCALLLACDDSSSVSEPTFSAASADFADSAGVCSNCDSYAALPPEVFENGGRGSVTTYGSVTAKETSRGGACNYGETGIAYYAAIHVNVESGDGLGPWQGGAACGGCVRVKAATPEGYKTATVRITDKCPDAFCGVDLGGAPAFDIMGNQVGRYYGEWEFVSCEEVAGVWGDSTSLFVKEGASVYWSVVQIRNPKDQVRSVSVFSEDSSMVFHLDRAVEAENFWSVPAEILQSESLFRLVAAYRTGSDDEWLLSGSSLAVPGSNLYLND